MMGLVDFPISFWGHSLLTAAFTLNRVPTKKVEKTPYEVWNGRSPVVSFMRIWGCDAFVKCVISDKLGPKSDKCKFVGYPKETRGYQFYNPSENKVFTAWTTMFLERDILSKGNNGRVIYLNEV